MRSEPYWSMEAVGAGLCFGLHGRCVSRCNMQHRVMSSILSSLWFQDVFQWSVLHPRLLLASYPQTSTCHPQFPVSVLLVRDSGDVIPEGTQESPRHGTHRLEVQQTPFPPALQDRLTTMRCHGSLYNAKLSEVYLHPPAAAVDRVLDHAPRHLRTLRYTFSLSFSQAMSPVPIHGVAAHPQLAEGRQMPLRLSIREQRGQHRSDGYCEERDIECLESA